MQTSLLVNGLTLVTDWLIVLVNGLILAKYCRHVWLKVNIGRSTCPVEDGMLTFASS